MTEINAVVLFIIIEYNNSRSTINAITCVPLYTMVFIGDDIQHTVSSRVTLMYKIIAPQISYHYYHENNIICNIKIKLTNL